jgi:hypothetical protein
MKERSAHKNRLAYLSGDFSLHYALNKGKSWSNWGSKLVLVIENQLILVRVLDLPKLTIYCVRSIFDLMVRISPVRLSALNSEIN